MRFPYLPLRAARPVYSLGGARYRHLPIFAVTLYSASGMWTRDGLLDTGASDTIFPLVVARRLGIDLTHAPLGEGTQLGGTVISYRYAPVELSLSDARETCRWNAVVGFIDLPGKTRATRGHAGFLQFFDALLYGARHEVVLTPNAAFAGTHVVH